MLRFALGWIALGLTWTGAALAQADARQTVLETDRVWGAEDAPVLVVEYSSHTCPHCARAHQELMPTLVADYIHQGAVKLVVRPFPLNEVALVGAVLSFCLPTESYYPFTEELYATQDVWARRRDPGGELVNLAREHGLSRQEASDCLRDEEVQTLVASYALQGQRELGVRGTPTYFINGQQANSNQLLGVVAAAVPEDFVAVPYRADWETEEVATLGSGLEVAGESVLVR